MKRVVVESPYAGDVELNVAYARACMRDSLLRRREAPLASHLLYTQSGVLDDTIPEERALGIEAGLTWGNLAEASVVYTDLGISGGMQQGIERAEKEKRPVERRRLFQDGEDIAGLLKSGTKTETKTPGSSKRILVLTGPTGAGKTELATRLKESVPNARWLVSTTTRSPRATDREYEYVTEEEFDALFAQGAFLWTEGQRGKRYGTKRLYVEQAISSPQAFMLAILTPKTAKILKTLYPENTMAFYLLVPEDIRRARLQKRGDSAENIAKGIKDSCQWDTEISSQTDKGVPVFDDVIRNDRDGDLSLPFSYLYGAVMVRSGKVPAIAI
ncbi:MAG: hypothetical protein Q7S09_03190 [bacterium]|nr:hypothetical protein [bacterium]